MIEQLRLRASVVVEPLCVCGQHLYVPRPWTPGSPPVVVTCGYCGRTWLASLDLDWYVREAVRDALRGPLGKD